MSNALAKLLGWRDEDLPPGGSPLVTLETVTAFGLRLAPYRANFNSYNYFLIKSNLANTGIRVNAAKDNVIGRVPIRAFPGSLIHYEPFNPVTVAINNARGSKFYELEFWITDDKGNAVNFQGEDWSIVFEVEFFRNIESINN